MRIEEHMDKIKLKIKKISQEAITPNYAHPGDAGLDLFSNMDATILPSETILIKTGISIELPTGYEAQVRPRSGLALKNAITVLNTPGTIDSGYRGEVGVIIINHGKLPFEITKGTKIAQMVINRFVEASVEIVDELTDTSRSSGGFGSTGN
jgi:dUTP pyrophosphatase